uniref:Transposase n=1 Tax=Dicentrarchus labrax TaxID=13489 RepID=A0A8P4KCU7_DICLA
AVRELPQKLREEIISSHLKGLVHKKISKTNNIQRDRSLKLMEQLQTCLAMEESPTFHQGRALNEQGLHGRTQRCTTLLTTTNIKSLLEYARRNLDKNTEFWETVLWTDETKLELFGYMDQRYVCRVKGQAYDQKNTIPTVNFFKFNSNFTED